MAGLNLFTRKAEVTCHTPPSPKEAIEMATDCTGPTIHSAAYNSGTHRELTRWRKQPMNMTRVSMATQTGFLKPMAKGEKQRT